MPLDCRVDPHSLRDEYDLPLLTRERLAWPAAGPLTDGQRAMLVLDVTQGQVNNGGFMQFFDNAGEQLDEVVPAARLVGADRFLPVLERAVRLWPEGLPPDPGERRAYLERHMDDAALSEARRGLDDDFYALGRGGLDLVGHALRYAHEHPADFFLSPDEARADVDDFIARLRARVGPLTVATEAAVARHELPALLRRLSLEVGDGGWGPDAGVLSPTSGAFAAHLARLRELRGPDGQPWPETIIPFCVIATGLVCVDVADPRLEPHLLADGVTPMWSSFTDGPVLRYVATSLRGWLERWLKTG